MTLSNPPVVASGLTKKTALTVTGSATNVFDFTSLDINTDGRYLIVADINDGSAGDNYAIEINGDTTAAHYHTQMIAGSGDPPALSNSNNNYIMTSGVSMCHQIQILVTRNYQGYAVYNVTAQILGNITTPKLYFFTGVLDNATVTNITQITIKSTGGNNIGVGSNAVIYKLSK